MKKLLQLLFRITVLQCMLVAGLTCVSVTALAQQTWTRSQSGTYNGYDYELWSQNDQGTFPMRLTGDNGIGANAVGGTYEGTWSNTINILFRAGRKFSTTSGGTINGREAAKPAAQWGNITVDFAATWNSTDDVRILGVYGWAFFTQGSTPTRQENGTNANFSNQIEYYIIQAHGSYDNARQGTNSKKYGEATIDGIPYEFYVADRIGQPALTGNAVNFKQYFSVPKGGYQNNRNPNFRTSGIITVSKHFEEWAKCGMIMDGSLYEVAMKVESYKQSGSSGSATVSKNILTVGGEIPPEGNTLTTIASPTYGGTVTKSPNKTSYEPNETVQVSATANAGWEFIGWEGDAAGTDATISVVTTENKTVTAKFRPTEDGTENLIKNPTFTGNPPTDWTRQGGTSTLTVAGGEATINITAVGENLWEPQLIQQGVSLEQGMKYRLSFDARAAGARTMQVLLQKASAEYDTYFGEDAVELTTANQSFAYEFEMTADSDPNAQLAFNLGGSTQNVILSNIKLIWIADIPEGNFKLTANAQPATGGTVTKSPNAGSYEPGTQVTLSASPALGYEFTGWSGDATGTAGTASVTMNANKTVTATFTAIPNYENLIKNGTFDGTTNWAIGNDATRASVSATDNIATINITANGAQSYQPQLLQQQVPLEQGAKYKFSFEASADAARTMEVMFQNTSDYSMYFNWNQNLTTAMQKFEYEFTMTEATDLATQLAFNVGASLENVQLKNVELVKISSAPVPPGVYEIATWEDFKTAAVTFTFDDACPNQFTVAVPLFNNYGYKASFFPTPAMNMNAQAWNTLRTLANAGHEVGNHSTTHPTAAMNETEMTGANNTINTNVGIMPNTVAYPNCVVPNKTLAAQYFIGGRICNNQVENKTPADYFEIASIICGNTQGSCNTLDNFRTQLTNAQNKQGWAVFLIHEINNGSGYSPLQSTVLGSTLDYIKQNEQTYWVTTFRNAILYAKERDAATVTQLTQTETEITLSLTDNLANATYNYPLSIRTALPEGWENITATQGTNDIDVRVDGGYIYFSAVPDAGTITIKNGAEVVIPPYDERDYLGAELYSDQLFRYGRFEARMYMAAQSGTVSSMFLYHNDSYMGAPEPWREIDIEVLGKSPSQFQSNMITGVAGNQVTSEEHHELGFYANAGYHTYAIEWTPDYIVWLIDDVEVRRATTAQITDLRDTDLGLRFNLWASSETSWVGPFDPQLLPAHQFINWIKYYEYVPGAGDNNSDFRLSWQDDFDTFDNNRWEKGDWTFDGNLAYLTPSNINVNEGTLIISLTGNDSPGFSGDIPCDHDFVWTVTIPATCETAGEETEKCSLCGALGTRTQVIPATGHSAPTGVWTSGEAATCETASTLVEICAHDDCDHIIASDKTPALGHDFQNYISDGNATCSADGTETATCSRCEETDTRTEVGSQLEHVWIWEIDLDNPSQEIEVCSICGEPSGNTRQITPGQYTWSNVQINGGGYVPGVVFHPAEEGLTYIRTDVGGAYRMKSDQRSWTPLNDMFSDYNDMGSIAIGIDADNANTVYVTGGLYTDVGWGGAASVFKSTNKGASWTKLPLNSTTVSGTNSSVMKSDGNMCLGGNGANRGTGNRFAVNGNTVYLGTDQNGLLQSTNGGTSWTTVSQFSNTSGVSAVLFDKDGNVYAAPFAGGLYRSSNGTAWTQIAGITGTVFNASYNAESGVIWFTTNTNKATDHSETGGGRVYKYTISSNTLSQITTLPAKGGKDYGYLGISVNPSDADQIFVSTGGWWKGSGSSPLNGAAFEPHEEIFMTMDGGATWKPILKGATFNVATAYNAASNNPHWISALAVNPFDKDHVIFGTGYGVWSTFNATAATPEWFFTNSGIEETKPLGFVSTKSGAPLVSVLGDIDGFYHSDLNTPPAARHKLEDGTSEAGTNYDIDYAGQNPDYMVRIHKEKNYFLGNYSEDGGETWKNFTSNPPFVPNEYNANVSGEDNYVAVSADGSAIVWNMNQYGVYYSTDNGATWTASSTAANLLAGFRPVADRVTAGTFYLYNPSYGTLYRSTNNGASWTAVNTSLATGGDWGYWAFRLFASPDNAGELWVTQGTNGSTGLNLWFGESQGIKRSTDGGTTFSDVPGIIYASSIGFGKGTTDGVSAVYAVGVENGSQPLSILRSDDSGSTWTRINDDAHSFGGITMVAGDPCVYSRVFLGTEGRGIITGFDPALAGDCDCPDRIDFVNTVCEHVFDEWEITKPATCTETGERIRTCSLCGEVEKEDIPMLEHVFDEWEITTPATCQTEGVRTEKCSICGTLGTKTEPIAIIDSYGEWSEWSVVTPATCEENGTETRSRTCTLNEDEIETETQVIPATEHTWIWITNPDDETEEIEVCSVCDEKSGRTRSVVCEHVFDDWEITKPATCQTEGVRTEKCSICGTLGTKTEPIAIIDSYGEWSEWNVVTPATCEENGTETRTRTCTLDDTEIDTETQDIPATGHIFDDWDITKAPTCGDDGIKTEKCSICGELGTKTEVIPATGEHTWIWVINPDNENEQIEECAVCGEKSGRTQAVVCEHDFVWTVTTPATCETDGVETQICSKCQAHSAARVIDKKDAYGEWSEWSVVTPATCEENGTETRSRTCTLDDTEIDTETQDIPATGHIFDDWDITKAPTCSEDGIKTEKCSICGKIGTKTEVIPATGEHTWVWKVNPDNENEQIEVCSVCNEKSGRTRPVICEHVFDDWEVITPATCDKEGVEIEKCSLCGTIGTQTRVIPKTDNHDFSDWEITQAPTCVATGSRTEKCSICGALGTKTEVIPATGEHTWIWVPNPNDETEEIEVCSVCDEKSGRTRTIEHEHNYVWTVTSEPTCETTGWEAEICSICKKQRSIRTIPQLTEGCEQTMLYKVTVIKGSCDKEEYAAGETVTITANSAVDGNVFKQWHSAQVSCADSNAEITTFVMPEQNVRIMAIYEKITAIETVAEKAVNIYPNPTQNELKIESGQLKIERIEIVNFAGKIIYNLQLAIDNSIDVSSLPPGVYIIKMYTGDGVIVRRFVKE